MHDNIAKNIQNLKSYLQEKTTDDMAFKLLNQSRAWFLKIDPVWIVGMRACVCVSAPEAINN